MKKEQACGISKIFLIAIFQFLYFHSFGQKAIYEIYALEFAGNWNVTASEIAVGASTNDTIKGSSIIWLLKGNNGRICVS